MISKALGNIHLWLQYARMGLGVGRVAVDLRSRLLLAFLGATTLWRSGSGRLRGPIRVRVRLGQKPFEVLLQTRTEIAVLGEIALGDIYADADEIPAREIIDLGANVGLATLRLLATHPEARVVAVEADPKLAARLRENVKGLPVTVVNAAIAAESGERTFYRSDSAAWANSFDLVDPVQSPMRVSALSLADLVSSQDVKSVDLLKIDVEGAEWEVFGNGVPAGVRAIVGEVHANRGRTLEEFFALISPEMTFTSKADHERQASFVAIRKVTQ